MDRQQHQHRRIIYVLPRFTKYDSWNVRRVPRDGAEIVDVVRSGEPFAVVEVVETSESRSTSWLRRERGGWLKNIDETLRPVVRGKVVRKPLCVREERPPRPPSLKRFKSLAEKQVFEVKIELDDRRRELESLQRAYSRINNARDEVTRRRLSAVFVAKRGKDRMVRLSRRIEHLRSMLELRGVEDGSDSATDMDDYVSADDDESVVDDPIPPPPPVPLDRTDTLHHQDFANPRAESCWLSSTFQALWHSIRFRRAFEQLIAPLPDYPPNTVAGALKRTWRLYKNSATESGDSRDDGVEDRRSRRGSSILSRLNARAMATKSGISPEHLVRRWGTGWGDPCDCISAIQSPSSLGEPEQLRELGDMIAQVPVAVQAGRRPPSPSDIWKTMTSMGVDNTPIVFINTSYPRRLHQDSLYDAVMELDGNLDGDRYRLRAMICYMHRYHHYVCFCARLSKPGRWVLFNDLPGLEGRRRGLAEKPLEKDSWEDVAEACATYGFSPTLLLYESGC